MTKAEALGRWLQLNPEVKKRQTVSTWRLAGAGDVLGWTLAVDGNAVAVAQVNVESSGANFAPLPAESPRVSLEDIQSWSLTEALRRIEDEQVTVRDLNALYRANGGNPRITWTAYTDAEELDEEPGVFVASAHVHGLVPLDAVLTGKKSIILPRETIVEPSEPDGGVMGPGPLQQDGLPEMTAGERIAWLMSRHGNS